MSNRPVASAEAARAAIESIASGRSLDQRLQAVVRRSDEPLSPRALRALLAQLRAIVDVRVSEVEAGRLARAAADWYRVATPAQRRDWCLLVSMQLAPDGERLRAARDQYGLAAGTPGAGAAEIGLRRALVSPRSRLLQRLAVDAEGMRFLVDLRAALLPMLAGEPRLLALDADLEQLFATWFDVAFLQLRRISWDSPASLIEKLIRYEAVHDIRGWSDVKNRLDRDRRCYGFFHPRLDGEPLIFVEVALTKRISDSIVPLLDETAADCDPKAATTAIFYSISNTQPGLRGVSFGDSLIKHVVQTLCAEFPRLRTFATLSPVPGFRAWLATHAGPLLRSLDDARQAELAAATGGAPLDAVAVLHHAESALGEGERSPLRRWLLQAAAHYLVREMPHGKPADPVARFHLGNGARVERLNWAGDPSAKGLRQSYGIMVNYLYDPKRVDRHRDLLATGRVPAASAVEALLRR